MIIYFILSFKYRVYVSMCLCAWMHAFVHEFLFLFTCMCVGMAILTFSLNGSIWYLLITQLVILSTEIYKITAFSIRLTLISRFSTDQFFLWNGIISACTNHFSCCYCQKSSGIFFFLFLKLRTYVFYCVAPIQEVRRMMILSQTDSFHSPKVILMIDQRKCLYTVESLYIFEQGDRKV